MVLFVCLRVLIFGVCVLDCGVVGLLDSFSLLLIYGCVLLFGFLGVGFDCLSFVVLCSVVCGCLLGVYCGCKVCGVVFGF